MNEQSERASNRVCGWRCLLQLGSRRKDPKTVAGAPFPPAVEHTDGPPERPRRDVPTAEEAEPEEEEST
jgi:hypothetical protein